MLASEPAKVVKVDIHSLLEQRAAPGSSPSNASPASRRSSTSKARDDDNTNASADVRMTTPAAAAAAATNNTNTATATPTTATTPASIPGPNQDYFKQEIRHFPMMQTAHYPPPYTPQPQYYPPMSAYAPYAPSPMSDPRLPPPIPIMHQHGSGHKRLAPPHPHSGESPAKKKQSKWTADEDASIIELRGNGMKWEDISKHLPGRSAISCRLRFQNYLERRAEWDEEKKNKLARLYERYDADSSSC